MPTYAYACTQCDHRFDAVQSFSDPALTECPQCAGRLRKEYGSIGVTFSGSGFYRNDSRNEKSVKSGDSAGLAAESKPNTAAETKAAPTASPSSP